MTGHDRFIADLRPLDEIEPLLRRALNERGLLNGVN
jgi:hypothetical protein